MRGMPFQPETARLSLQITPVEAICNVAVMRTILPGTVFGDAKGLPTMGADNLAFTAMVDQFRVGIPPFGSAGIRAENSAFPARNLNQSCSAALTRFFHTAGLVRNRTAQVVPFAVSFHRIHGQSHQLPNLFIAVALPPKGGYLAFL